MPAVPGLKACRFSDQKYPNQKNHLQTQVRYPIFRTGRYRLSWHLSVPHILTAQSFNRSDCTAYAYAGFHQDFIRNKVTLIGCPKLDQVDYSEKLTAIIQNNDIQSVTIVRMEVPCCGGLEMATRKALQNSGKFIPWQVITIGIDGNIIE